MKVATLIDNKFFFKRDLLLFFLISITGIFITFIVLFLNYPKINKKNINQYKIEYQNALKKKKKYQKKFLFNQKRYIMYKKYLFTKSEIYKITNIIKTFNAILNKSQTVNCLMTNYSYGQTYLNTLNINIGCDSITNAKKYKLIFGFFFSDFFKNKKIKIQKIQTNYNSVNIKFFKYINNNREKIK